MELNKYIACLGLQLCLGDEESPRIHFLPRDFVWCEVNCSVAVWELLVEVSIVEDILQKLAIVHALRVRREVFFKFLVLILEFPAHYIKHPHIKSIHFKLSMYVILFVLELFINKVLRRVHMAQLIYCNC